MVQSSSRLRAAVALLFLLLPVVLTAQTVASDQLILVRHQKVLAALSDAGVTIGPIPTGTTPTFHDLLPAVSQWAAIPSKEMDGLETLIGETFPSPWERLARFHQFKVEGQEQPRTVLAYPSPTSTTPAPILNPDRAIFKYTVTSKASEFFPTTQDVADQIKSYTDAGGTQAAETTKLLCRAPNTVATHKIGPEQTASCLSKTRKRDVVYRFFSGYSGTFSYSDNPQVVQNIVIQTGTPQANQNRLFSGELVFDPSNVFLTGTDWKNVSASKDVYSKEVDDQVRLKLNKKCPGITAPKTFMPTTDCLARLAGPTGWTKLAAALMPTVDYKIQTQFDFIKSGANFIEPPYPLGHLYDFSFTQDFRRVFPTAKQREDAVAAINAFKKSKKSTPPNELREAVLSDFKRVSLDETRLSDDGWYYKFLDKIALVL